MRLLPPGPFTLAVIYSRIYVFYSSISSHALLPPPHNPLSPSDHSKPTLSMSFQKDTHSSVPTPTSRHSNRLMAHIQLPPTPPAILPPTVASATHLLHPSAYATAPNSARGSISIITPPPLSPYSSAAIALEDYESRAEFPFDLGPRANDDQDKQAPHPSLLHFATRYDTGLHSQLWGASPSNLETPSCNQPQNPMMSNVQFGPIPTSLHSSASLESPFIALRASAPNIHHSEETVARSFHMTGPRQTQSLDASINQGGGTYLPPVPQFAPLPSSMSAPNLFGMSGSSTFTTSGLAPVSEHEPDMQCRFALALVNEEELLSSPMFAPDYTFPPRENGSQQAGSYKLQVNITPPGVSTYQIPPVAGQNLKTTPRIQQTPLAVPDTQSSQEDVSPDIKTPPARAKVVLPKMIPLPKEIKRPGHVAKEFDEALTETEKMLQTHHLPTAFMRSFMLQAELGCGGFGFVCVGISSARHKYPNREFAIKFIWKQRLAKDKEATTAGIPNEVYILQNLNHPNIVKVFEVHQDEQFFILVSLAGLFFDAFNNEVEELHGSPWSKTGQVVDNNKGNANPCLHRSHPSVTSNSRSTGVTEIQPAASAAFVEKLPHTTKTGTRVTTRLQPPSRPPIGRRNSHDLYEAVESKKFTIAEARHILRQIGECCLLVSRDRLLFDTQSTLWRTCIAVACITVISRMRISCWTPILL